MLASREERDADTAPRTWGGALGEAGEGRQCSARPGSRGHAEARWWQGTDSFSLGGVTLSHSDSELRQSMSV